MEEKDRSLLIVLVSLLLCIPIFYIDITTPRGYADQVLYLIPIIITTLYARKRAPLLLLGLVTIVLTVVGLSLSPRATESSSLVEGLFTTFAIVMAVLLGQLYIRQAMALERSNRSLQENYERLQSAQVELERANRQLTEKTELLNRSNEDLRRFASVASHDLKSPLATTSSFLQLLQQRYRGKVLDQKAEELIGYAVDGTSQMARLIDDLLQYSSVDHAGGELEQIDMNEVLAQVEQGLEASLKELGATVSSDPLPRITANRTQMVQLLQNLVANAIKFHGQEAPRVHVSAEKKGDGWQFSVRDNGIGIRPEDRDKLFKMFSRLHSRQEYEGTGIGLATVKRIVERHGGAVWFDSEVGKGSTFYFTIPDHEPGLDGAARGPV
jgi:signal transduction histidine kinase